VKIKKLTTQARELRNNQTAAERYLWQHLRKRQLSNYKVRRQHVFKNFIVDFVCLEAKLIVEIDGKNHQDQIEYDANCICDSYSLLPKLCLGRRAREEGSHFLSCTVVIPSEKLTLKI